MGLSYIVEKGYSSLGLIVSDLKSSVSFSRSLSPDWRWPLCVLCCSLMQTKHSKHH